MAATTPTASPRKRKPPPKPPAPPPPTLDGPSAGKDLRRRFLAFDDVLASKGVPPLTKWWREGIGSWLDRYEKHKVLELYSCVGRGAAKSTAMYKLALFFAIAGDFVVPVGEVHYAVVLSRLKEEASKGVAIIGRWLELLGIPAHTAGDLLELDGERKGIRVVAASVAAATGWRAFFVGKDERSKWRLSGLEEEDAGEVDTSASAMTATHPLAPTVTGGSAWGNKGAFYETVKGGSNKFVHVLGPTPTWIAAPHITEEDCRRKERDKRKFLREYASIFQAGTLSAFDSDLVEAAFQAPCGYCDGELGPGTKQDIWCGLPREHEGWHKDVRLMGDHVSNFTRCEKVAILDPTAGGSDTYAFAMVGWRWMLPRDDNGALIPDAEPTYRLVFDWVGGIERAASKGYTSDRIVKEIATEALMHGVKVVHSDQFEKFSLDAAIRKEGFNFVSHAWTAPKKERAIERVRVWLADGTLVFGDASGGESGPSFAKMKNELLDFQEKIASSGALTFKGRQGGHDDFAMLVLLAALVDIEKGLPGSPLFVRDHQVAEEGAIIENRTPENSLGVMTDSLLDGLAMVLE